MRFLLRVGIAAAALTTACGGPVVVTTDDTAPTGNSAPAATPTTTRPSNVHLANAFDFAAQVDGRTGYYFVSPSGRWECAIVPRVSAACQNAQSTSRIGITGVPDEVPGPDGEPTPPNAVVVDRTGDPQVVALPQPGAGLEPGPAMELPFNRILAAAQFRCNVQESSGISCMSEVSGKGFTFSADGFTPAYTDVPPGAP